jgi:hypothetical protein
MPDDSLNSDSRTQQQRMLHILSSTTVATEPCQSAAGFHSRQDSYGLLDLRSPGFLRDTPSAASLQHRPRHAHRFSSPDIGHQQTIGATPATTSEASAWEQRQEEEGHMVSRLAYMTPEEGEG